MLVNPEIHWNTGAVGRTCLGTDSTLHLIRPLGFSLDSKHLKRAGLDYWEQVSLKVWDALDELLAQKAIQKTEMFLFSRFSEKAFGKRPGHRALFCFSGPKPVGSRTLSSSASKPAFTGFQRPTRSGA